jgi:hypothetical protein
MKLTIGLMGVGNDGKTLYLPNGKKLFKLPSFLAWRLQKIQHKISYLSHK